MPDDEDWLWRPVLRGMLKAESLLDPSVKLEFIWDCNNALDAQDENDFRLNEATKDDA
jgi:hypothetical protein